jgi:transposase
VERASVVEVSRAFGFSRETYYVTLSAFQDRGIPGLLDGKPGRPGPLKLTDDVARWIFDLHGREPELNGRELAERLAEKRGIEVHRRTVERLLGKK